MKWALIIDGEVMQVTDEPFEVAKPWYWAQCPEKVQEDWTYDAVKGFKAPKYVAPDPVVYRDYPPTSEQLDILWHDMDEERIPGKHTSQWYEKIKSVKEAHPK